MLNGVKIQQNWIALILMYALKHGNLNFYLYLNTGPWHHLKTTGKSMFLVAIYLLVSEE